MADEEDTVVVDGANNVAKVLASKEYERVPIQMDHPNRLVTCTGIGGGGHGIVVLKKHVLGAYKYPPHKTNENCPSLITLLVSLILTIILIM